ncbi:hypothetical protein DVDV_2267 [Desulfovibrio sp. DV]|nr:hypothetical protein DVDV_2267 [Desulfovibrio sp. DV]
MKKVNLRFSEVHIYRYIVTVFFNLFGPEVPVTLLNPLFT